MTLVETETLPSLIAPPSTTGAATLSWPRQVTPSRRLARAVGLLEDAALITLLAYLLPLALLLVTTPIGLLIRLVVAVVGAL